MPLYHVDRLIIETGKNFQDGSHIIYVNGSYKNNNDPIGKLMHDFRCTSSGEMFYPLLAKQVSYFKEAEGGQKTMSKSFRELAEEVGKVIAADMAKSMAEGMAEDMAKGMAEDMAKGMAEDMAKGMAENMAVDMAKNMAEDKAKSMAVDMAKNMAVKMLEDNVMSVEMISRYTNLPIEVIEDLAKLQSV